MSSTKRRPFCLGLIGQLKIEAYINNDIHTFMSGVIMFLILTVPLAIRRGS